VYVAVSHDQGNTWTLSKVTAGNVKNNQDQRVVTDASGNAYLVFDNGVNGGKGLTVLYASKSTDGGTTWSAPVQFATLTNPVCIYPPYCFNLSGGQFRSGGSYPAPAFDNTHNRLDVLVADIRGPYAQMYVYSLKPNLSLDFSTQIPGGAGDRFMGELSAAPNGRLDASYWDRSYSGNALIDLTYATSSDGGQTWQQARVTPKGYDPSQWGVPSSSSSGFRPFIGDYNGIASTNTSAYMTWTGVASPQPLNLDIDFATATP
jgi:Neuraminidase (sialidase)